MKISFIILKILLLLYLPSFGQMDNNPNEIFLNKNGKELFMPGDCDFINSSILNQHDIEPNFIKPEVRIIDSLISQNWDRELLKWNTRRKTTYKYDENENKEQETTYSLNHITNSLIENYKADFLYNADGNMIEQLSSKWDRSSNNWIESYKWEYNYDAEGYLTMRVNSDWNDNIENWVNESKLEIKYNDDRTTLERITSIWDRNVNKYFTINKLEHTYNQNGDFTFRAYYNWNKLTNKWVGDWKNDYAYDLNGNLIEFILFRWSYIDEEWAKSEQLGFSYSYNTNNNLDTELYFSWNTNLNQWQNSSKKEYKYNQEQYLESMTYFTWSVSSNDWTEVYKYEYLVVSKGGVDKEEYETFYDLYENKWRNRSRIIEYYSVSALTNVSDVEFENVAIYPNPFDNYLAFGFENIANTAMFELYSINGIRILSKRVLHAEKINLSTLTKGVYFYTFESNNKKLSGKLIKK